MQIPIRQQLNRLALPLVALLACVLVTGCLTPVVVERNGVRLGLYRLETEQLNEHVTRREVRGVGLSLMFIGFGLGYVHNETIVANLEEASYQVALPFGELFVGEAAEIDGVDAVLYLLEPTSEEIDVLVRE